VTQQRFLAPILGTAACALVVAWLAPFAAHAGPVLDLDNECGEVWRVWLHWQPRDGAWTTERFEVTNEGRNEPKTAEGAGVELHGDAFFYYAEAPASGRVLEGADKPVRHAGRTYSMTRVGVSAGPSQQLALVCREPAVHRPAIAAEQLPEKPEKGSAPVGSGPGAKPPSGPGGGPKVMGSAKKQARPESIPKLGMKVRRGSKGLVVVQVTKGGPATDARIREGDRITHIDGKKVAAVKALRNRLRSAERKHTIRYVRKGQPETVTVKER